MPNSAAPLVSVERAGVEEAIHLGHLAVVGSDGQVRARLGDPDHLTYFRSCAKPFQSVGSLGTGIASQFDLRPEHVAIMSASHNGEARHVEIVRDLLARAAVPESALQCGAHWPIHDPSAALARRQMNEPLPIFNNCSGKHAGMLAAAKALEAPLETYLAPDHPVQRRISDVIAEYTRRPAATIHYGVDGCSAPNPAVPLAAMARSFAALVRANSEIPRGVVAAMIEHPFLIGGTDRFDTRLMEATGGRLLAKAGAAGAHCTADRESGLGLAIKLDSGDGTWTAVAGSGAAHPVPWAEPGGAAALSAVARPTLRNHRRVAVGAVRPVLEFAVTAM